MDQPLAGGLLLKNAGSSLATFSRPDGDGWVPSFPKVLARPGQLVDLAPREVGGWLAERGIVTRTGFHCAPLAHQTIGSHPHGGTVRFSFGWSNTAEEVDRTLAMLDEMAPAVPKRVAVVPEEARDQESSGRK